VLSTLFVPVLGHSWDTGEGCSSTVPAVTLHHRAHPFSCSESGAQCRNGPHRERCHPVCR
jgi:hypothetical protein